MLANAANPAPEQARTLRITEFMRNGPGSGMGSPPDHECRRSIRWAPTRRDSTGWVRLPDASISSSWQGGVAEGPEVAERLAADHAYIDALRPAPVLPRLGLRSDVANWLLHQALVAPTSRW